MKFTKYCCVLITLLCAAQYGLAQGFTIRGTASDTLNMKRLRKASVVLIRATDSVIAAHTRTGIDGSFALHVGKEGKYILRITAVSFADYSDLLTINKEVTDVGDIPLLTREHVLSEFVITKQIAAIKIKGDTTEYMADSFKTKEGANVEDLLKRLPGIQVDKNGKITAQGETVQKVLVDGEEFFSDDPKVVTQGLQAAVVSKVQVYDKKSDQAEFTGIDDGEKTKTINLQIKEDKKKGYFGKVDAGGGTDGYFQDQGMINAFKGKRQLSAFGITSNTDKVGLGWGDNDKFGGGSGLTEINDNGYYTTTGGSYDDFGGWNGTYEGEGLPKIWTGGIHFANKWNEEKDHISGSYRYARQNVEITGDNITQYSLGGDTIRINNEHRNQFSKIERHGFSGFYDVKIDSNNSFRIVMDAGLKNSDVATIYHTETWDRTGEDGPRTINDRTLTGDTKAQFINTDLLFKKKFAKKGQTLSIDVKENYQDSKGTGYLKSTIQTPDAGLTDTSYTNQKKINNATTLAFSAKATYTEPLSKVAFLELNYGVIINNSTALNYSYDSSAISHMYDHLNDTFSSNYKYNILTNKGGLSFKFVYKNYNFSFGSDVSATDYLQTDLLKGVAPVRYNYPNIYPKANFVYKFGKQTSLKLYYEGSTKQPTISQIAPLSQNTDPLNVTDGNTALKQQFSNTLRANFNDYKVLTHRYMYFGGSASSFIDAISTSQTINGPVSHTKYVNVNGNYSTNWWAGYDFKIKKLDLDMGFSVNGNQNHNNNYINELKNASDNSSYSIGPNWSYYKEDKYEFRLEPNVSYTSNRSTISTYSTHYWSLNNDITAEVQFTKKLAAGTTANMIFREKTVAFPTNNQMIKWNAFVSRKFLKKNELEVKFTIYDILNQNAGFTRTTAGSTITQQNYNTIRRYAMLSLVWNFTHTPGAAAPAADEKK